MADGTSICPSCDYIIDASFISADAPQGSDDGADAGSPPPRKRPAPSRANASRPAARGGSPAPRTRAPAAEPPANSDATNIRSMEEIVRNAPQRPARSGNTGARPAAAPRAAGGNARPAPAPRREPEPAPESFNYEPSPRTSTGQIVAPEEVIDDVRNFVGVLSFSDKIAFGGAVTIIVSAFLPWKETAADGEILGLMSSGILALLCAVGIISTIAIRVRRLMPNLNVLAPWMTQLGLSIFSALFCLVFMKLSYDATEVPSPMGNATIMNSTPSFGVFLALLGALTSLGGTLLGLKEKPIS